MRSKRERRPGDRGRFSRLVAAVLGPRMPLAADGDGSRPNSGSALQVCGSCGHDFVNLTRSEPVDDDHRYMSLRCGNCGGLAAVVVPDRDADRFAGALEAGCEAIADDVRTLERQSMAAWAETFAAAIDRDLVQASDFAP